MLLTHQRIDLLACQQQGIEPGGFIEREPRDTWLVSTDAIRMDQPITWQHFTKQTHVYVPLVPYLMPAEPDLAMAFMLQIGLRCAAELARPVKRLHLVTGVPVNDVWDEENGHRVWQYHVGLALVLDS